MSIKRRFGVYCLLENHWQSRRRAEKVASMFEHSMDIARLELPTPVSALSLHADNFAGQKKNGFLLWYLLWRYSIELEKNTTLYFSL